MTRRTSAYLTEPSPACGRGASDPALLGPSPLAGEVREGGGAARTTSHAEHPSVTSPKRQHYPPPGSAIAPPTSPARGEGEATLRAVKLPSPPARQAPRTPLPSDP